MSRLSSPYAVVIAGIALAGAVLLVVAAALPETRREELAVEAAKAAIQVIPFALLTVVVAELVRRRDDRRAEQRRAEDRARELDQRRDEIRRRFLGRVVLAYNRAKAVRRTLRGAGFSSKVDRPMTDERLRVLDHQIAALNDAQLDLERLKREAKIRGDVFSRAKAVEDPLRALEKYVNRVVRDWEDRRAELTAGSSGRLDAWPQFRRFVADEDDGGDFGVAADEMDAIEDAIWPDLLDSKRPG